jgi:hypothetical protein
VRFGQVPVQPEGCLQFLTAFFTIGVSFLLLSPSLNSIIPSNCKQINAVIGVHRPVPLIGNERARIPRSFTLTNAPASNCLANWASTSVK